MPRCEVEISVCCEQFKIMTQTQTSNQCIDSAQLNAIPAAKVSYFCSFDMVRLTWNKKVNTCEMFSDSCLIFRP